MFKRLVMKKDVRTPDERLRNIARQIGHPDYSLRELRQDLLDLADDIETDRKATVDLLSAGQRP